MKRLKILDVTVKTDPKSRLDQATVTLSGMTDGASPLRGSVLAVSPGPKSRQYAVGHATVLALNTALKPDYHLCLTDLTTIQMGAWRVAAAVLRLLSFGSGNQGHEDLVGAVISRDDPDVSVVKAVLDSVNRRLGKVVVEASVGVPQEIVRGHAAAQQQVPPPPAQRGHVASGR
ncbi:MAG: hypothetical protein Q8P50_06390 [Bacillota bacterium]|nr:hypothetical protein [Bacillota bacterium]